MDESDTRLGEFMVLGTAFASLSSECARLPKSPQRPRGVVQCLAVRRPLIFAILVGLLAAGCGGSKSYDADKTRACLAKQSGVQLSNDVDFVASTALGGAFNARLLGNKVTLSFGEDRKETQRIVRAYQRFRGQNIGLTDVLRPKNNVVILWAQHPTDTAEETIQECLK